MLSPNGEVHQATTPAAGAALAAFLMSIERSHPVVAVSVHPDVDEPYIDVSPLAGDLEGLAVVVVLGPDATFGLTDALGDRELSVFYGASRVYPVGRSWLSDRRAAPLILWHQQRQAVNGQAVRVGRRVLETALTAAHAAGLFGVSVQRPAGVEVIAEVVGPLDEQHVLLRADGRQAVMLSAHLVPGLSADRVVAKGQRLAGTMHPAGIMSAFQPHPVADEPAERVRESYASAHAVLAKVDTVSTREATVLLHPQVRASLLADDPETDWRDLLSAGDVVSVEVIWEGQDVHAALADEDRETALAVGVLPGGPAWLTPADREPVPAAPTAGEEAATGHAPATGPVWAGSLDVHDLRRALEMSEAARAQLGHELEVEREARTDLEARAARMRSQARRTARRGGAPESGPVFADPEQQWRHEVWLTYLERTPEQQRADYPLPVSYALGPHFLPSLAALQGIERRKVLEVVVEVLSNRAKENPSRCLKPWLDRAGGKQQVRYDDAKAWRVYLQHHAAAARRLKFWRHAADHSIELDFVGTHDEGLD